MKQTTKLIEAAFAIVVPAFDEKVDLAGNPYIHHLFRVYYSVNDENDTVRTVALLHDLLEDCPEWTKEKLSEIFPDDIVEAVVVLTHRSSERYIDYIDRVTFNMTAIKVKIADLKDNMDVTRLDVLGDKEISRLKKYHKAYKLLTNLVK